MRNQAQTPLGAGRVRSGQRLFFAVMVPEDLRRDVAAARRHVPESGHAVRWVRPEGMHLTVRFLGECPPEQAAGAGEAGIEAVEGVAPFQVAVAGLGVFPNAARPHVVWAGVRAGAGELTALHDRLERALRSRHVVAEDEHFTAHLTLGRVRQEVAPAARAAIGRAVAGAPVEEYGHFTATQLELVESVLGRDGARYTTVASFAFQGRSAAEGA